MDREEFGVALLLSLPVAVGVAAGVLKQTLGSWPLVAAGAGLVAGGVVFGVVAMAVRDESRGEGVRDEPRGEGPPAFDRLAERVVPDVESTTPADLLLGAGLGALVTVFLWYIPLSPLLGGAAAGVLQGGSRADARTAGALSGALVPLVALVVAAVAFLVAGAQVFGRFPFGPAVAALVAVGAVAYAVGLGTVGGWVGGLFLEDERRWGAEA